MSVYSSRLHNAAMLAAVEALAERVGDCKAPDDLTFPYCVVYPLGSSTFGGPMSDLDADAFPTTQVTFCGQTRDQAEWLQDKVRTGIVGTTLTVAGRSLGVVRLHAELPAGKDETVTPFIFWAVDRYRCFSTPA